MNLPGIRSGESHVYQQFTVKSDLRNELQQLPQSHDVSAQIHNTEPANIQPAYEGKIRCHKHMSVLEGR